MDRNEKRNSYRNTNNTRGVNQKVKAYRSKMIAAIAVAAVLLVAVIVLTVGYVSLHSKYTEEKAGKQEETTADTVIDTSQADETNAGDEAVETTPDNGDAADEAAETPDNGEASNEAETPGTGEKTTDEAAESGNETDSEDQTAEAGSENGSEEQTTDAAEAESGTDSGEQNADGTVQFVDAETIKKALDEAIKEYAGLNYWLVPATGAEVITNAEISAAETALGEVAPDLGKIFVLGKLYDRMNNSTKAEADADYEPGITDEQVENPPKSELTTKLRVLTAVMLGELESYEKIAEGTNAAADMLIGKVGEYSKTETTEDGENTEVVADFAEGQEKVNAFCKDVLGCEGVEIRGFDVKDGETPVNTFNLADCLTFFDKLQETNFGIVDTERLNNMKNRLKWNTEDEFVKATQEVSSDAEVLYAGKAGTYEIYSVESGAKSYVIAVNASTDTAEGWKTALAKAAADAVPGTATAETQADVVIAEDDNQDGDETAKSGAETQPNAGEKKSDDAAPENGEAKSGIALANGEN